MFEDEIVDYSIYEIAFTERQMAIITGQEVEDLTVKEVKQIIDKAEKMECIVLAENVYFRYADMLFVHNPALSRFKHNV